MDKPDIVEWAENWLGIQLFEWQKIVLRAFANGTHIVVYPTPRIGKRVCLDAMHEYYNLYMKENDA